MTQQPSKGKSPEDVKRELQQVTIDFNTCFNAPAGQSVLKHLSKKFEGRSSVVAGDPYATHTKEGERYVLLYIKDMITIGVQQ